MWGANIPSRANQRRERVVAKVWNRPRPLPVPHYVIDFGPLHRREASVQDLAAGLTREDLGRLTREMSDLQLASIEDAMDEDVVMVPDDPDADDTFAARPEDVGLSWTLGHVVVHTTASSEESAALALVLARGLPVEGRSRYEVPWEQARSVQFIRRRIEESCRMRLAMLAGWPDPAPPRQHLHSLREPAADERPRPIPLRFGTRRFAPRADAQNHGSGPPAPPDMISDLLGGPWVGPYHF